MENNNNAYGLVEWDQVQTYTGKARTAVKKDYFLRLETGDNIVRLVTEPHQYWVHRYKTNESDPGYGQKVLSCKGNGEADPLEESRGMKPKRRFLVGVIDRKTGTYKVLDMSSDVMKKLKVIVNDEEYGHPSKYDIKIVVDPDGGPTNYYTVIARPLKPLSAGDLEIQKQADLEDLKRRCTPPSRERMLEIIARIDEKSGGVKPAATDTDTDTDTTPATQTIEEDDDFPAADGSDA